MEHVGRVRRMLGHLRPGKPDEDEDVRQRRRRGGLPGQRHQVPALPACGVRVLGTVVRVHRVRRYLRWGKPGKICLIYIYIYIYIKMYV